MNTSSMDVAISRISGAGTPAPGERRRDGGRVGARVHGQVQAVAEGGGGTDPRDGEHGAARFPRAFSHPDGEDRAGDAALQRLGRVEGEEPALVDQRHPWLEEPPSRVKGPFTLPLTNQ
jgi:hypothetical protein